MKFRSQPLNKLSTSDTETLGHEKNVFERRWNRMSAALRFRCQVVKRGGKKLVIDETTKLSWQQSGSSHAMTYNDAEKFIDELNKKKFAGYKDWRFPTLDEAMSLLRPRKNDKDLYIDPAFDQTQQWIWTMDEADAEVSWVVTFRAGCCYVPAASQYYVRAVRGEFWFPGDESLDRDALLELFF
jgi:hypothetical protein